jgi:uncharacterized protein YgbK (DUF1537 family)
VIFTSRVERRFADQAARLAFGEAVSAFLMDVVRGLPATLGFLISKGGITSNDVLSHGLALKTSRVLGQILPGCSVVRCPAITPIPGSAGGDLPWQRGRRRCPGHGVPPIGGRRHGYSLQPA